MPKTEKTKTASVQLPTVISTSVILNTVVRAAESAAVQLGSNYYSVVRKELFRNEVAVYKDSVHTTDDPLDTAQAVTDSVKPIWSMDLADGDLEKKGSLFSNNPPQYFFLTKDDAVAYLKKIEKTVIKLVLKAAENALKETT